MYYVSACTSRAREYQHKSCGRFPLPAAENAPALPGAAGPATSLQIYEPDTHPLPTGNSQPESEPDSDLKSDYGPAEAGGFKLNPGANAPHPTRLEIWALGPSDHDFKRRAHRREKAARAATRTWKPLAPKAV